MAEPKSNTAAKKTRKPATSSSKPTARPKPGVRTCKATPVDQVKSFVTEQGPKLLRTARGFLAGLLPGSNELKQPEEEPTAFTFDFEPKTATPGDEVTIHLGQARRGVKLFVNDEEVPTHEANEGRELTFKVPAGARSGYIELGQRGIIVRSEAKLVVRQAKTTPKAAAPKPSRSPSRR